MFSITRLKICQYTMPWLICTQIRPPTPYVTLHYRSTESWASSWVTPWPIPMHLFFGRHNLETLAIRPNVSLISLLAPDRQNGFASLVLWCCCPMEWKVGGFFNFWPRASPRGPKSYYFLLLLLDFVMFWNILIYFTFNFLDIFEHFWIYLDIFWTIFVLLDAFGHIHNLILILSYTLTFLDIFGHLDLLDIFRNIWTYLAYLILLVAMLQIGTIWAFLAI